MVVPTSESEVRGLSQNGKTDVPLRITRNKLSFPNHQPQSKQITPLSNALSPLRSDKKVQINGYENLLDEG